MRDSEGRLIAFGGRILGDGEPKYLNSPESPLFHKRSTLFCLDRARRAIADKAEAVVVEGYFDCFSLHLVGINHVVATLGTALTAEHARLLRRRVGADGRVVLCYDADSAGRRAAASGPGSSSRRVSRLRWWVCRRGPTPTTSSAPRAAMR